jgi:hypothetical protein
VLLPCQSAKASELGRIGGRSKRHSGVEAVDALPTLDNALAIRDTVARLIVDVYAGKIHPRIAASLAPLINLQLRAIETTDLERRVAKLEKLLAEAENRVNGNESALELDFGDLPMPKRNGPEHAWRTRLSGESSGPESHSASQLDVWLKSQ